MQATLLVERLVGRESNVAERARMFRELEQLDTPQFVFMGDMVSAPSGHEWRLVDGLLAALREGGAEVAAAVGNHDIMFSRTRGLRALRERGMVPATGTWQRIDSCGLRLLLIDTNPSVLKGEALHMQSAWFLRELAIADEDPNVAAVVVVGHHPPMTNARLPHTAKAAIHPWCAAFEASKKGHIWASGHVHAYERLERRRKLYVVAGSAGGPRVGLRVGAAMRTPAVFQLPHPSPFLWLELEVNKHALHMHARGFANLNAAVQTWDTVTRSL